MSREVSFDFCSVIADLFAFRSCLHVFTIRRFFMPHGLTVDHENNTWLTDVALHQVCAQSLLCGYR